MLPLRLSLLPGLMLLAACTTLPPAIREAPPGDLSLTQVLEAPGAHNGSAVRWGGTVTSVNTDAGTTWLEVQAYPLYADGEPVAEGASPGRFLARTRGELDPEVFHAGREITVRGVLTGEFQGTIGRRPYAFPVVAIEAVHAWREGGYGGPCPGPCYPYDLYYPYYPYYPYRHYPFW